MAVIVSIAHDVPTMLIGTFYDALPPISDTGKHDAVLLLRLEEESVGDQQPVCVLHETVLGMRLADQDGKLFTTVQLMVIALLVGLAGVLYVLRITLGAKRKETSGKPKGGAPQHKPNRRKLKNKSAK